jgi:hypothetical protein
MGNRETVTGTITKVGKTSWYTDVEVTWPNGSKSRYQLPYEDREVKIGDPWTIRREVRGVPTDVG